MCSVFIFILYLNFSYFQIVKYKKNFKWISISTFSRSSSFKWLIAIKTQLLFNEFPLEFFYLFTFWNFKNNSNFDFNMKLENWMQIGLNVILHFLFHFWITTLDLHFIFKFLSSHLTTKRVFSEYLSYFFYQKSKEKEKKAKKSTMNLDSIIRKLTETL